MKYIGIVNPSANLSFEIDLMEAREGKEKNVHFIIYRNRA